MALSFRVCYPSRPGPVCIKNGKGAAPAWVPALAAACPGCTFSRNSASTSAAFLSLRSAHPSAVFSLFRLTAAGLAGEITDENQHQQAASGSLLYASRRASYPAVWRTGIRVLSALPAGSELLSCNISDICRFPARSVFSVFFMLVPFAAVLARKAFFRLQYAYSRSLSAALSVFLYPL